MKDQIISSPLEPVPPVREDRSKRVLFIDRDGTLINEAPPTYQLDSFDKLTFYPAMFE